MRCFLCKISLLVPAMSIRSSGQPEGDTVEGFANFCTPCTERLYAAIDDQLVSMFKLPVGGG